MKRALALLLLSGCSGTATPDAELRQAVPSSEALSITMPTAQTIEATAELWRVTRQTTDQMNGIIGSVLDLVHAIAAQPPTRASGDVAMWGPFTPPLSPITVRLVIERVAPDAHRYRLDARPKDSSDDAAFQVVLAGNATTGAGDFVVNRGVLHALDPAVHPDGGTVYASYQALAAGVSIRIHIDNAPMAGDYLYDRSAAGDGDFRFAVRANLVGDDTLLEDGLVRSRWLASGAGRGDAHVHNGDAGAGLDISQCWDDNFVVTTSCVFPDAQFADL
jgi:hypothetical protein